MTGYYPLPLYDMEDQTSGRSIDSIRITRKLKTNGTTVRIKETLFSDGTSSKEEKVVFCPSSSTPNPHVRTLKSHGYRNDTRLVECSNHDHTTRDHSLEYRPTSIDKPAPVTIMAHYRLPQSTSSRIYPILRILFLLLLLLSLCGLITAWFLAPDRSIEWCKALLGL